MNELMTAGSLAERMNYAQALAASNLLPASYRKQPANVLVAIEYGYALGLAPMVAIQSIHVVDGKPTASAQLIGGLVRRAGHRLRVSGDDRHAVAEIVRSDDPEYGFKSEWTLERAQAAGLLGKGSWKSYPAAMLKARAITEVARDACPEVLAGVAYTPEELGAEVEDMDILDVQESRPPRPGHKLDAVRELMKIPQPPLSDYAPPAYPSREEIEEGEVLEEKPAPDAMRPGLATWKQIAAIESIITRAGRAVLMPIPSTGVLDIVSLMLGIEIEDLADLTKEQASVIIGDAKEGGEKLEECLRHYLDKRAQANGETI